MLPEKLPTTPIRISTKLNNTFRIFGTIILVFVIQFSVAQKVKPTIKKTTNKSTVPVVSEVKAVTNEVLLSPNVVAGGTPLSASITKTYLTCPGDANGSITAFANGGLPGYEYSIDTGQTYQNSGTFNNLRSHIYTITVRDANGHIYDTVVSMGVLQAEWVGNVNNNWHTAGNWSTGAVPDANTHVIIPTNAANNCVVSGANAVAASIQLKTSKSLQVNAPFTLLISGRCPFL